LLHLDTPILEDRTMIMNRIARGLGWFSLAVGAVELFAPGRISRVLGVRGRDGLIRSHGVREIGSGLGVLFGPRPSRWLWARVAGDALDLGALHSARQHSRRKDAIDTAMRGMSALTALDVAAAARLSGSSRRERQLAELAEYLSTR
jgi:hypothetical protein